MSDIDNDDNEEGSSNLYSMMREYNLSPSVNSRIIINGLNTEGSIPFAVFTPNLSLTSFDLRNVDFSRIDSILDPVIIISTYTVDPITLRTIRKDRVIPENGRELTNRPIFYYQQENDHEFERINKPIKLTKEYKRTTDECCILYDIIKENCSYRLCTNVKVQHTITWNRGYSKNECPVCTLPLINVEYINGEDPVNIEIEM